MDPISESNKPCKNCGTEVSGLYCHHCGQSASIGRITFRETINQFFSASFSLQGPLLSTIRLLVVNPGRVFREFIAGRRKSYYQPVSFFVLLTAVYIIVRVLIDYDPLAGQFESTEETVKPDIENPSKLAAQYMVNNINYIMFFLAFSVGLMFKVFFRKRYNLAEYTSIGFYIGGMYVLIGTFLMLISKYFSVYIGQAQLLILALLITYYAHSFFGLKAVWPFFKYILVSILGIVLYMFLGFGFSFLMVSF